MKVRPISRWLRPAILLCVLAVLTFALYLDFRVRDAFDGRRFAWPSRVFARPLELYEGARLEPGDLEAELRLLGYREGLRGEETGRYERHGGDFELITRPFTFSDGAQVATRLTLNIDDDRIARLADAAGGAVALARLDAQVIGGIYPAHNEDRVPVQLSELPPHFVAALLAVEDRQFYSHIGIDPRGIARAIKSTVTGGGVQGGSTLTQQLVKNFFLTPERTLRRKFTEVIMALLLELHYDKDEILETYLNEIYLGQDRNRAIHGVGLAAQFYFAKPASDLTLAESALLVALIKGPSHYDPHRHPDRALARRNLVLSEMKEQAHLGIEPYTAARATLLAVADKPGLGASPHPAFLDLVRRQLKRDYDEDDLKSEGLRIFTTLHPRVQAIAERALSRELARLDPGRREGSALEGAVIVTDAQSGEVQALVGGRDPLYEGFNRALDAARPVGSLLKPAIYLTALSDPMRYTLATRLDDSAFTWESHGAADWTPQNYDHENHGQVPLPQAIAHSYNVASARLGLELGIERVLDTVRRLGIERDLPPHAATLLGAVELSPFEVAQMYQTIAANGFRAPLRAIREVASNEGKPLSRYALSVESVFEPQPMYLLTFLLQGAVRDGTGRGLVERLPAGLDVAGKTGTTDELRDSWFAGFSGDRLAVAWVGYDDNHSTGLTGAAGAMTVWGELMRALDVEPLVLPVPENIERVWIDPDSGLKADRGCAGARELPFIAGSAPKELAPCVRSPGGFIKSWWRRLFE